MTDDELPAVLTLLASSGGTARSVDSWNHDQMTALLLGERGAPAAAMPISQRSLHAAPHMPPLQAGWLSSNQFAARMGLRRQTHATVAQWPGLLANLDALIVLRRDETTWRGGAPARWYNQTGFDDVLSIRCLYLEMESPPPAQQPGRAAGQTARYHVQVISPTDADGWSENPAAAHRWQGEMRSVYRDVYGAFGGAPLRTSTFWQDALAHHYYRQHYQFQIIGLWNAPATAAGAATLGAGAALGHTAMGGAMLMGYAVVGWSGWHSKRPRMDILELATRQWDAAVAADLIQTTCQLAWSKNVRQVRAVISAHDPYRGHFTRTAFVDRWGYVMLAKWLHAQRRLDALGPALPPEFGDLTIHLQTPGEIPLILRRGSGAGPVISLTGNRRTITRLLLNRLEITSALQEGSLAPTHGAPLSDRDLARLSLAFPWTPWAFHMLDYI